MMSLHRVRFVVVHLGLYSTFLWTPEFSVNGKFIPKIPHFDHFARLQPTFLKPPW